MPERFEFPEAAAPIEDWSGLIPLWVHHLHDLNRVEAENILNAQRKYLPGRISAPQNWFQVKELKAIHHAMFGDVWEWAGFQKIYYIDRCNRFSEGPRPIPTHLQTCHMALSSSLETSFVEY